jgi:acetylornithine deacetylase
LPARAGALIDAAYLRSLAAELVRIDSVNPDLEAGGGGEAAIAAVVAERLREMGAEVEVLEHAPGRCSVVGRFRGAGGGRSLMLNAHLDTVGVAGMDAPFSGEIRAGRLYGRGAYDMKGSLAACLATARTLRECGSPLRGDLLVAAVADEENASVGTAAVAARYPVDAAIVAEPTALRLCAAHKGFAWVEVETRGRAAHGSRPDLGVDANLPMGRVLAALEELERELRTRPPHPLLGAPSLHAATVQGGSGPSTYAERCRLLVERRTVPGESGASVMEEVEALLERLRRTDASLEVSARLLLAREPFEAQPGSDIGAAVERAAAGVLGATPERVGEGFWMDAALLAAAGADTAVIGPDGAGAHAAEEWVDLASLEQLVEILVRAAGEYCG